MVPTADVVCVVLNRSLEKEGAGWEGEEVGGRKGAGHRPFQGEARYTPWAPFCVFGFDPSGWSFFAFALAWSGIGLD